MRSEKEKEAFLEKFKRESEAETWDPEGKTGYDENGDPEWPEIPPCARIIRTKEGIGVACLYCDRRNVISLPVDAKEAAEMMQAFAIIYHRRCERTAQNELMKVAGEIEGNVREGEGGKS